jgi:hypothetical protein
MDHNTDDIFASSPANEVYGSFYADGTWNIVMGCYEMGYDGTNFYADDVAGCVPGGDFAGFMEELKLAITSAATGATTVDDITALLSSVI